MSTFWTRSPHELLDFDGLENWVPFFHFVKLLGGSIAHVTSYRPENTLIRKSIIESIRYMKWNYSTEDNLSVVSHFSFFVILDHFTPIENHTKHFWWLIPGKIFEIFEMFLNSYLRLFSNTWLSQKICIHSIPGLG